MDTFFSNIQQTFDGITNDTTPKNLLDKQRITEQKINDLLESTTQSILCGPTCQKEKVSGQLEQKYLDAKTNMLTAPIELEQSKKNYFVFKEGETYYNTMKEEELQESVNKISELLVNNFNDEITNANTMNIYLNSTLINSENTNELLEKYSQQNELLKVKLRERHGDILTNDRKTYYEVEALDSLKTWYTFLWYIYYIVFIMFVLSLFLSPNNLGFVKSIIMGVFFIFYPYYIDYILRWIYGVINRMISSLPKNVYNDL